MSIATYAELKTALVNFSDRSDLAGSARLDEFITLAHSKIHYGNSSGLFPTEPLRIRAMEASADVTISGRTAALPTRYIGLIRNYISGDSGGRINFMPPSPFWDKYAGPVASGTPVDFTIEGENFVFGPSPDATYTGKVLYYQAFAPMTSDADTNWLLTNAPSAYLQGALIELWDYLKDWDAKAQAEKAFAGTINALNLADVGDRFAGPWAAYPDTYSP